MRSEPQRDFLYAEHGGRLVMEGQEVFKHAVARMTRGHARGRRRRGHRRSTRSTSSSTTRPTRGSCPPWAAASALDPAKVVDCIADLGNVSAASLPLALAAARADGRLADGARVLLSAFGAGFIWGAAVVDWRATA